ncbi:MAG: FAD-dependent oxidoreductase, partial [Actinomycetota bacterium]
GFAGGVRLLWDDLVPDDLERSLPPIPYVREGRRLVASYNLGAPDLADTVRGHHRFDDAVMLGGYFTDFHGCPPEEDGSGYGLFEVPIRVFIPETVDGFLPGIARAAGVSRVAAAAVRTQPEEMWGGQVAGAIAGLAATQNILPREVAVTQVQQHLLDTGLVYFLP